MNRLSWIKLTGVLFLIAGSPRVYALDYLNVPTVIFSKYTTGLSAEQKTELMKACVTQIADAEFAVIKAGATTLQQQSCAIVKNEPEAEKVFGFFKFIK